MFLIALCGVAMLIGAGSCKKEKPQSENVGEEMTINASLNSADGNSKTHLVGPKVYWDNTDAFKLFPKGSANGARFKYDQAGADGTNANFVGTRPGTKPFYACYPYDKVTCTLANTYQFEIPETQTEDAANAGPMAGYFKDDGSSPLVFQNVMSWLKVGLKGNAVVKRIVLIDKGDNKLNGKLTVTCNDTDGFGFTSSMSEGSNKIELVTEGAVLSDDYKYFNFLVPVGSLANVQLQVYASDDLNATPILDKDNLSIAHDGQPGMPENYILTADVSSSIDIIKADVETKAGCSDRYMYELSAKVKGNDSNFTSYEVGFCYNITSDDNPAPDPTVDECDGFQKIGTIFTIGNGSTKDITYDLAWLQPDKTYKVRAYAMNGVYSYGDAVIIEGSDGPKPLPTNWENGTNPHTFKIGASKSVYFSQANLQYRAQGGIGGNAVEYAESGENVGGTWRFAEHQFDYVGADNSKMAWNYDGWIDLFGFGTSGYNHNGKCYQPWSTSTTNSDYYAYSPTSYNKNLEDENGTADWGKNTIYAGGTPTTGWRTLTQTEWSYLINSRTNASKLKGEGKVGNCTPGLILLPDDWDWNKTTLAGLKDKWIKDGTSDWKNVFSYSEWARMEAEGAIFLPAAGYRSGTGTDTVDAGADYHASTQSGADNAKELHFESNNITPADNGKRMHGHTVRLVKNAN